MTTKQIFELSRKLSTGEAIEIDSDGNKLIVATPDYVKAKTQALREWGYPDLTEEEVSKQVEAILDGKDFENGLNVIGGFMKNEIKTRRKPQPQSSNNQPKE